MERNTIKKFAIIIDDTDIIKKVYISESLKKALNKTKDEVIKQLKIDESYIDGQLVKKVEKAFNDAKDIDDLKVLEEINNDNCIFDIEENYFSFIDCDFYVKVVLTSEIEKI
jgi:hypothetical protein